MAAGGFAGGAADVREGGRWSPAQRFKNDVLYGAACVALVLCRVLPRTTLERLGKALGGLGYHFAPGARSLATRNVQRALPLANEARIEELVRSSFQSMGATLGDSVASLFRAQKVYPMGDDAVRVLGDARAEGRGVVLPSAHIASWERMAATLVAAGFPLVTLVRESYDPRFDRLLAAVRRRGGVGAIPRGGHRAAFQIVRALRAGNVLGAPMDLASRVPSVSVPFLGVAARTAVGPARIALRARTPLVVSTVERVAGRLEVTCTRLDTDCDETTLTARINQEIGRRILTLPEAWPWMHDRWDVNH